MDVRWEADLTVEEMVNEGVRQAYLDPDNKLRASILADPAGSAPKYSGQYSGSRQLQLVRGGTVDVTVAAKGGGSEAKSKFVMLESLGLHCGLGAEDGSDDGRGMVPPGHAGHRHRRHGRKSDADG